jgi:protein TonB
MYRSNLKTRDKGGAIAAVAAIHAGLLFVFMHMSGKIDLTDPQSVTRVFDVTEVPPPQSKPEPPTPAQETERPKEQEGAASAENLRSQATPVVAPEPPIELPIPVPIATTQTPNEGAAPTQGAADVAGPGTGAGGTGTGTGSGGTGSGTGGGGDGGIATRAQPITRGPRGRDFPSHLRRLLSSGYSPWVRFTIEPNGRLSNCRVYQSSGNPELDSATCALVMRQLIYRPAFNRRGEPVASEGIYRQAF